MGDIVFPDPEELAQQVNAAAVEHNLTVRDATVALRTELGLLKQFETVEDLAVEAYEEEEGNADGPLVQLTRTMTDVRNAIADVLWPLELFVAVEILDELLFQALRGEAEDPAFDVLRVLRDARVNESGLLLFGVHSIGVQAATLSELIAGTGLEFVDPSWGVAISPQTNDLERTIEFLHRVADAFGVRDQILRELMHHWRRSRHAEWLEKNPLLAVRVAEASGSYYGNQALLVTRLQAATVLVAMLASLQPNSDPQNRSTLTTRVLNNFETLDIHHYLVLSPGRTRGVEGELGGDFVPISGLRADLVEMSTLRMDFSPAYWGDHQEQARMIADAVQALYRDYLRRGFDRTQTDEQARLSRRRFESTVFFQRSFSGSPWRDIISLSTAFELLLHPSGGNTSKIIRGVLKAVSKGFKQKSFHDAFDLVYKARNEIMHDGQQRTQVDLAGAREAFVRAFVHELRP